MQVGHVQIADWSGADCAMADWPRDDHATMRNRGENAQGQIKWRTRKGRYDGSLENCRWGSGFKTVDLVRESKRRFWLVVRLIANECYEDKFYFLSCLTTVLRLLSSHILTSDYLWDHLIGPKPFKTFHFGRVSCYPASLCLDLKSEHWRSGNFIRLSSLLSCDGTGQS